MHLELWLLLGSTLVLSAIVAVRLSYRAGLPSLLIYIALGLLVGEAGLGIDFDDAELAEILGLAALVLILAEGGITTDWRRVRDSVPAAISVSVAGTLISIGVVAGAAMWLLGMDWQLAFLLSAVLAPTDAAAVFSVLRRLPLPSRLTGLLEAESGFNDAPVVIIVVALSTTDASAPNLFELFGVMVYELIAGGLIGFLIGWLGAYGLRRVALPASGLYPIAVLSLSVGAYGVAAQTHASGFLAVYVSALVLGNSRLPHRPATRGFAEGIGWLAQIGLFVMLGLLASPDELPAQIVPALIIGFVLLLVARPLSVVLSTFGFRLGWGEKLFASWAGLRGAVPIILATIPMVNEVAGADRLFAIVFNIVVVFTLLQGPTLPLVARWCRLRDDENPRELGVEAAPLEELHAELLEIRVPPDSLLGGVELFELRLPPGASITLVVRDGASFVPGSTTALRGGDTLLVVATEEVRELTERRLRAISRRGKLAGWFGETGA
ncbi:potassium/proton antiporter [Actinomadura rayongensis]|uniref:Potassium/proton antiporter n=1 Tax=Actinomadura rayongensis TaxID=1429076 RepID=A0A6I4W4H9_9ACTN|nr:potassium/proton antiporter [Actinomadura rayongensis]